MKKTILRLLMIILIGVAPLAILFNGEAEAEKNNDESVLYLRGSHEEIGSQYGEQAKSQIQQNLSLFHTMAEQTGFTEEKLSEAAVEYEDFLIKANPEMLEQLKAMAESAEADYRDLLAFNALEEEIIGDGCTTVIATGTATQSGNAYYHKNRDASRGAAQVVVQADPEDGYSYIGITSAGSTGLAMGVNEHGVSVGNNVLSTWDTSRSGYGNLTVIRMALEAAADAREGVQFIEELPRASGSAYGVTDSEEGAWVETTANHSAVYWVVDEAMAHTNHYILPGMEQFDTLTENSSNERWSWYVSTDERLDRAQSLLDDQSGKLNVQRIVKISEDQETGLESTYWIDSDAVINGIPMGSVSAATFDGSKKRMWSQLGQPSTAPAIPFDTDRPHIPEPFGSGSQSERIENTAANRN
jgi:predicted choloylglycine hydrolase